MHFTGLIRRARTVFLVGGAAERVFGGLGRGSCSNSRGALFTNTLTKHVSSRGRRERRCGDGGESPRLHHADIPAARLEGKQTPLEGGGGRTQALGRLAFPHRYRAQLTSWAAASPSLAGFSFRFALGTDFPFVRWLPVSSGRPGTLFFFLLQSGSFSSESDAPPQRLGRVCRAPLDARCSLAGGKPIP